MRRLFFSISMFFLCRSAALASLKALSNVNGKYVTNQTVPELTNLLPETSLEKGRIGYKQTLTAFKILSPFPTIFQAALPALLSKLDVICKNGIVYLTSLYLIRPANS